MRESKVLLYKDALLQGGDPGELPGQLLCLVVDMCPADFPLAGSKNVAPAISVHVTYTSGFWLIFWALCVQPGVGALCAGNFTWDRVFCSRGSAAPPFCIPLP